MTQTQPRKEEHYEEEEPINGPVVIYNEESLETIPDSEDEHEPTPESSDDEYSEYEGPHDNEILNFAVDGPEPVRRMVLTIVRTYSEIFPTIQGKRRLNRHEFDNLLKTLGRDFWTYRQAEPTKPITAYRK
ncbi:hypothetical protein LTR62_001654 [Meristemomyces frigidus]|uniref:Uncharacterized protein n=1 Tax=Meristemomyces frigidus TaxID=1508187 RepID=A0AAN7T817_9PEZI|nr:hypothetical protein LTR62_001654 [Meristemomyces frigidus]